MAPRHVSSKFASLHLCEQTEHPGSLAAAERCPHLTVWVLKNSFTHGMTHPFFDEQAIRKELRFLAIMRAAPKGRDFTSTGTGPRFVCTT